MASSGGPDRPDACRREVNPVDVVVVQMAAVASVVVAWFVPYHSSRSRS